MQQATDIQVPTDAKQQDADCTKETLAGSEVQDALLKFGEGLLEYIVDVREDLESIHSAIEEYKDPDQLHRVAQVFTGTPVTTEGQFEWIQERMCRITSSINIIYGHVHDLVAVRTARNVLKINTYKAL